MTSNFADFVFESAIHQLILENELRASTEFISKLKSLSKKSNIADKLYDYFDDEYYISKDLPQNWIDIDGEDTISFISDKKAEEILAINQQHEIYKAKGRGSVKIGRFIKALSKELFEPWSDKEIEEFVNLYKSTHNKEKNKFKIIKGSEIKDWYNEDCYADSKGTLGGSCMRDVSRNFFNLYTKNEKVCSLLIYIDENRKLIGRALVWKLSESPCEAKYFMDRVYCINDSDVNKFKNFADEKGWMYKHTMNSHCLTNSLFMYQNAPAFGKIEVILEEGSFDNYPFLDTLCFMNQKCTKLSNLGFLDGSVLQSVDGYCQPCENCGGSDETCIDCIDLISALKYQVNNNNRFAMFKKFFK
jgi:hypothetical protein